MGNPTIDRILRTCLATGKVQFDTPAAAKAARKRYRKKNPHEKSHRSYLCDACGYHHNTSMPIEEARRRGYVS